MGSERIWERFCKAMKREDLLEDPEYSSNGNRVNNRATLIPLLQDCFLSRPVAEWVQDLQEASVPCGPINDIADVFADPHVLARDMYREMPHPTLGSIKQTGLPIKFSKTPSGFDRHPPLLGEHNQELLAELGYSEQEIRRLAENSVI